MNRDYYNHLFKVKYINESFETIKCVDSYNLTYDNQIFELENTEFKEI